MLAAALETWVPYIDFSTVQILDLGSSIQGEALAAWADRLHFPALRTLRLFLGARESLSVLGCHGNFSTVNSIATADVGNRY
jgi:hypothetical protein